MMIPAGGPSRNGLCPCGSGKKYKRCCALPSKAHVARVATPPSAHSSASRPASSFSQELLGGVELARNVATEAHALAVSAYHLDVLFEGVSVGGLDFKGLFVDCLA